MLKLKMMLCVMKLLPLGDVVSFAHQSSLSVSA